MTARSMLSSLRSMTMCLVATVGGYQTDQYLHENYGPQQKMPFQPGDEVVVDGEKLKVLGYSGHGGNIAERLVLDDPEREVWVTTRLPYAQGRASENGKVAVIAARTLADQGDLGDYSNTYRPHLPKPENKYTTVHVQPVNFGTDTRIIARLKRAYSHISSGEKI